jgi:hypothetical protein
MFWRCFRATSSFFACLAVVSLLTATNSYAPPLGRERIDPKIERNNIGHPPIEQVPQKPIINPKEDVDVYSTKPKESEDRIDPKKNEGLEFECDLHKEPECDSNGRCESKNKVSCALRPRH